MKSTAKILLSTAAICAIALAAFAMPATRAVDPTSAGAAALASGSLPQPTEMYVVVTIPLANYNSENEATDGGFATGLRQVLESHPAYVYVSSTPISAFTTIRSAAGRTTAVVVVLKRK